MNNNKKHPILILLLTFLLTSCGYHLQGILTLAPPLKKLYLQTPDPFGYLSRTLEDYLKMSDVELVQTQTQATANLVILRDANSQNLLSVSATQQTRQYNLHVTVDFQITDVTGRVILPPQTLVETRTITVQSNQILGSSNEAAFLYQQMRRNIAYAMMNRIASQDVTTLINREYEHVDKK